VIERITDRQTFIKTTCPFGSRLNVLLWFVISYLVYTGSCLRFISNFMKHMCYVTQGRAEEPEQQVYYSETSANSSADSKTNVKCAAAVNNVTFSLVVHYG
jgi:hypothetical protein